MRSSATRIAATAVAIALAAGAGCRRPPLAGRAGEDAGVWDAPTAVDRPGQMVEAGHDVAPDLVAIPDTPDVPGDDAPADVATDTAPPDTAPPDRPGDGSDGRADEQPCGPSGFICAPYRCDLALGRCKTTCATDDDCVTGRLCARGSCGLNPGLPCSINAECASGICSRGTCCTSACDQPCMWCGPPGTVGACMPFPPDVESPLNGCPAGNFCDVRGRCFPSTCTVDTDCGDAHWCTGGRCRPCAATCASDADCVVGATCFKRNFCTYCDRPNAGPNI